MIHTCHCGRVATTKVNGTTHCCKRCKTSHIKAAERSAKHGNMSQGGLAVYTMNSTGITHPIRYNDNCERV